MREADLPAEQPEAQEEARVSSPHEDPRREGRAEVAARPGPRPAVSLIWRVRGHGAFRDLARAPSRRDGPLWLRFRPGDGSGPPRTGYAVGRRVGSAPVRNRLRRRMRAVVSDLASELAPGASYLFGAEPAAVRCSPAELRAAIGRLVAGAGR